MPISVDPVTGLPLTTGSVLTVPPIVLVYGKAGVGKSTAMAQSFHDCYWITTHETVLRPYASWLRDNPKEVEAGHKIPDRFNLQRTQADGVTRIDPMPIIEGVMQRITALKQAGQFPYRGVVIDEFTDLSHRINAAKGGGGWAGVNAVKAAHQTFADWARANELFLGLVCHEADPKYGDDGKLEAPGGPALTIANLRAEIGALTDVCLRLVVKDVSEADAKLAAVLGGGLPASTDGPAVPDAHRSKTTRFFVTEAREEWISKFRDFSIAPEENGSLRGLLVRAGYIQK